MIRLLSSCLIALAALVGTASAHAEGFITRLLDKRVPGGVAVLKLGDGTEAPTAFYRDTPVMVIREDGREWIAIVGIPLKAQGAQQIDVHDGAGTRKVAFEIGTKRYAEQHIRLKDPRMVTPPPEESARIESEMEEQSRAYRTFTPGTPSNIRFDKPVDGPLSSAFGLRRFFNGEERNPHSGLDFAVPAGTPIHAPAAGRVILVGDLYFNGNAVFIDHGQGLISMFCHMSRVDVKVGDEVPRGGVIGAVGATGRATGPHMHCNVSLNDVRVDPAIFIGAFRP